jgi:formiminotetrahydrofolate cyclodeaminase
MMARTAALSALYNVKINLASIKDTNFVEEIREEIKHMESEIVNREREFLSNVSI